MERALLHDSPLPPQQARSPQTAERITAAALELLEKKSFAEMSVTEIARRAGVSVGGFYARFPSKDALLRYFDLPGGGGILASARDELDADRLRGRGARDVVEIYV